MYGTGFLRHAHMNEDIEKLYGELKNGITPSALEEISVYIIDRYRNRDHDSLSQLALLSGSGPSDIKPGRLFARLIQMYHPDKLNRIRREIDALYRGKRFRELVRLRNTYLVNIPSLRAGGDRSLPAGEEPVFTADDFGYGEEVPAVGDIEEVLGPVDAYAEDIEGTGRYNFTQAVNSLYFGNLERAVSASDLGHIDGELDLSGLEIEDLQGIEHCVNVTVLNLSGNDLVRISPLSNLFRLESLFLSENSIEDIGCLKKLPRLRELDLSFNNIEDISVLLDLDKLEYVNVVNNPLGDLSVLEALRKRGVIVVN